MSNPLKNKLQRGEKVIGTMFQLGGSIAVECLGVCGLDFFIIDTEHAPFNVESQRAFMMAAELHRILPLIRIKRISRDVVLSSLDMGAAGLIAPGVRSVEEVRQLIEYGKYPPRGSRGFCYTRTSDYGYGDIAADPEQYFLHSNSANLIIPQCETRECLEVIEEICAIPEVDGIFIGPYDLSVALGAPAQFDTPEFKMAIERIVYACQQNGKFVLIFCGDEDRASQYLCSGFDGVVFSSDINMLVNSYRSSLDRIRASVVPCVSCRTPALHSPDPVPVQPDENTPEDLFSAYMAQFK